MPELASFRRYFDLVDTYARLNLKAESKKTILSYLWWVLEPILYVCIFYFVFAILLNANKQNFIHFLICGKIPFLWIAKSINNTSASIIRNKGLLSQSMIQPLLFPFVTLQESLYKQLPVFVLLLVFVYIFGVDPTLKWLLIIPLIIVTYLLIVPIALAGSLLVCFIPDARMFISLMMTFLIFVSGIFWDVRDIQNEVFRGYLLDFNPVAFLVESYRQVLIYDEMPDFIHISLLALISIVSLFLIIRFYKSLRSEINKRVLSI